MINSLDSSTSPPQLPYVPLCPFWMEMLHLRAMPLTESAQTHSFHVPQTATLHQSGSREEAVTAGWRCLSVQGGQHTSIFQQSVSHPYRGSAPFPMMQTVSLRQWLTALLPAPPEPLAGGGPSRMTDDIGLLQAGAEGSHTKYSRCHLRRTQTFRK